WSPLMCAKVQGRAVSLLQPSNIMSPRFGPVRVYPRPQQTERHRTFTLSIRRYAGAILGLLLLSQLMAGLIGARRLQLVIIPRGRGCLIRPSTFQRMAGQSRWSFMIIGITQVLMCWLIFIWHHLLTVALPGNPTSGLLLYQPMLH